MAAHHFKLKVWVWVPVCSPFLFQEVDPADLALTSQNHWKCHENGDKIAKSPNIMGGKQKIPINLEKRQWFSAQWSFHGIYHIKRHWFADISLFFCHFLATFWSLLLTLLVIYKNNWIKLMWGGLLILLMFFFIIINTSFVSD